MKTYEKLNRRVWYDAQLRNWVLQTLDSDGNQIGDVEYDCDKAFAMRWLAAAQPPILAERRELPKVIKLGRGPEATYTKVNLETGHEVVFTTAEAAWQSILNPLMDLRTCEKHILEFGSCNFDTRDGESFAIERNWTE